MDLEQPGKKDADYARITYIDEAEGENCNPEPGLAAQNMYSFGEILPPVRSGRGPGSRLSRDVSLSGSRLQPGHHHSAQIDQADEGDKIGEGINSEADARGQVGNQQSP